MTQEEKKVILAALKRYEVAIKDSLVEEEHTTEEVQQAFDYWNVTSKLIEKYMK